MSSLICDKYRQRVDKALAQRRLAKATIDQETAALNECEENLVACMEAQQVAQALAKTIQARAHQAIASVVTRALAFVFDEPYEFVITFEEKRGRTEAALSFTRDGHTLDPKSSSGYGPMDVAAFALRMACLCLHRPPKRRLLILDEPFKWVSVHNRPRVRALLEMLATEMQVQIIMVTHMAELQAGTIIEIGG